MAKYDKQGLDFFIKMNMQNPPKPTPTNWFVRIADDTSIDKHTVCGFEFTLDKREDSFGIAEGASPDMNFRNAFLPEEGHYVVSRDFSGQELRILANLANEQIWIDAFMNGNDIHEATARTLWSDIPYDKSLRKKAKAINFGLVYGISAIALGEQLGVTTEEAQGYMDKYFEKLPNIKAYLDKQARTAERDGELANAYGRKRRFKNFIEEGKMKGEGIRRSYNFPIQSMGAEVTKLAIIKLYNKLYNNPEYKDKVLFMSTIHDEINSSVDKSIVAEVAKLKGELMLHMIPGKVVPVLTGLEVGNTMGLTWKFMEGTNKDGKTVLIPEVNEVLDEDKWNKILKYSNLLKK